MASRFIGTPSIMDEGERVTHLYPNSCYFAHLSIYQFALAYIQDADVLDAGSGSGYGSDYLAAHGARSVLGIDASAKAIDFSRRHFSRPNLDYRVLALEEVCKLPSAAFDVIFTSNTLEHVSMVRDFLTVAGTLLRPDGVLLVAVPPIYHAESRAANLANPFHVNIWSPRQWHYALQQYFAEVSCIRHHFEKPGVPLDFFDTPETTPLTEKDFLFLPSSVAELSTIGALTAIFVAAKPLPAVRSATTGPLFVDDSFTRLPPRAPGWRDVIQARMIGYLHRLKQLSLR